MIPIMQQQAPELSIRRLCELAGVGRTWWYTHPSLEEVSARDAALRDAIERIVLEFPGYGYRRVTHALHRQGWIVNHKRVLRVMRHESLLCQLERAFVLTTDSAHERPVWPNLIRDLEVTHPDQIWVADLTYIRLPSVFCYLACVLDAFSRRCIGWKLGHTLETTLPLAALNHALQLRSPVAGIIHHSDRGVQYASTAYTQRLQAAGFQISMSAPATPYDNAKMESFFKTLKREEVYLHDYTSFAEAEANLERFIEEVYNTKRLHSQLGYRPPCEFENEFAAKQATKTGL